MTYIVVESTDGKHLGAVAENLDIGSRIEFSDGMIFVVEKIESAGNRIIAGESNYVCIFERSEY